MKQLIFTLITTELKTNSVTCVTSFKLLQLPPQRSNSGPFNKPNYYRLRRKERQRIRIPNTILNTA
jgi:hypothetical protein